MFHELEDEFCLQFGTGNQETRWFFAPGRVNLIGEHIDYCGGNVLPATIDMGTFAVVRENGTNAIRMNSTFIPKPVSFIPNAISYKREDDWGNYPKGVFLEYHKRKASIPGLDILYHGNLPGGGLSRSASIEVCTAMIIEAFSGFKLDADPVQNLKKMALLCQYAENSFIGVHCGIMDQAAIALGKPGKAMLLNCDALELSYIPMDWKDYRLIIVDSNKTRDLANSNYNSRRKDTEHILDIMQKVHPVKSICTLTMEQLPDVLDMMPNTRLKKRIRHVISENHRVSLASEALLSGKLDVFGRLLMESHISLRDDYEVTGEELDFLFEVSSTLPGVLGARMTGGGFGGCFIVLVHKDKADMFEKALIRRYSKEMGYPPTCYTPSTGMQAGVINQS